MDQKKTQQTATTSSNKEGASDTKKYNFYRKPSLRKKAPEVKQTLTSYKRMLKANPLLKYEMEGKDISTIQKQIQNSTNNTNKPKYACTQKLSLQPTFSAGNPLSTNPQMSKYPKNAPSCSTRPVKNSTTSIISGSKQLVGKKVNTADISKQSGIDFNMSNTKFLSSTRLENGCTKKQTTKQPSSNCCKTVGNKAKPSVQINCISSSKIDKNGNHSNKSKKDKPIRRSLSAQHFERKKGSVKFEQSTYFTKVEHSQSMEDVSKLNPAIVQHDISPIAEGAQESSMIFKTPSAYERRSIMKSTPKSVRSTRRSLYRPVTPLPTLNDLQKRLNNWLAKRGKSLSSFHHLKCFGVQENGTEIIDEENKENIEVDQDLDKGSYEELRIEDPDCAENSETKTDKELVLNEENYESIAKAALEDLLKLIQDAYPVAQCEGWLELIRQRYRKLEEEPQYWECRAAIEQSRGNISDAVQCYQTAIVQGAEIESVDESLDILLQKFSLLNISTKDIENEKSVKERARIVKDARNVFKSSIIQFAVQERKLKKDGKNEKKFVAIPVRRSTRLSRSSYTSTPGIKICSSLNELESPDRAMTDFKKNTALF